MDSEIKEWLDGVRRIIPSDTPMSDALYALHLMSRGDLIHVDEVRAWAAKNGFALTPLPPDPVQPPATADALYDADEIRAAAEAAAWGLRAMALAEKF